MAKITARADEMCKYPKEELLSHAEALFGVKREVLAAAMSTDRALEYTVDGAKSILEDFMGRSVK